MSNNNNKNRSLEDKDLEGGDVVRKINLDGTVTAEVNPNSVFVDTPSEGSLTRVKQVLCYDPIVAISILLLMSFFLWQTKGLSNLMNRQGDNGNELCRK